MKRVKDKNLDSLFVVVALAIVVIILSLIVLTSKKEENYVEDDDLGWMEGIKAVELMNVSDFGKNICNKQYHTSSFKIKDNNLYDYKGNLIKDKMFTLSFIRYSECNTELMFVTSTTGKLYYINNYYDSKLKRYELIEITDADEIISLNVGVDDRIIGYDKNGSEIDLTDNINEVVTDLGELSSK